MHVPLEHTHICTIAHTFATINAREKLLVDNKLLFKLHFYLLIQHFFPIRITHILESAKLTKIERKQ